MSVHGLGQRKYSIMRQINYEPRSTVHYVPENKLEPARYEKRNQ